MASANHWSTIHAEREALAADLDSLGAEQWATPSLCSGWTVRQVLGHMTATAEMTPGKFFSSLIGSGFRFNAMTAKLVAKQVEGTPADTLARFKAQISATTAPPGPGTSWLGETLLHSEDIRRPLLIGHDYPIDALVTVADFYKGSNALLGSKKRIAGLSLRSTDADWTTGTGPEVAGPTMSLLQAMTGRKAGLDNLSGDGAATLKERM